MKVENLKFVYNANSGPLNAVLDSIHKTFSPKTYECNLCAVTYTSIAMKKEWKKFIQGLEIPVEFLYRDSLKEGYYSADFSLPAMFTEEESGLKLLISSEEMNDISTLAELIELVKLRIS